MIERILENWLDNASERSYQLPFCYLLMQQHKTILHLTRHTAMEHGKDIIATDQDGQLHVYQLKGVKGGKLKLSQWQTMIGQLTQLAVTPVTHPSINSDKHHLSYLVVNGELEEEVFNAIHAYNQDWRSKGMPQYCIHAIVRGEILQWALAVTDQFIPSEFEDFKLLLEFFLDGGKGMLDRGKFTGLLHSIFVHPPESAAAQKRLISSAALLCLLALSAYQENHNHIPVMEGWTIYIAEIFHFATQQQLPSSFYSNELAIAETIIQQASEDLLDEVKPLKDFFVGHLLEDIFVFKHRTLIILGHLAHLGLRLMEQDPDHDHIPAIQTAIEQQLPNIAVWGEGAVAPITVVYWFLKKRRREHIAIELLKMVLVILLSVEKIPNLAFTNYYLSAEETILLMNDANTQVEDIRRATSTEHVAETIIHLLAINHQKEFLQGAWSGICDLTYIDFDFVHSEDMLQWRCETGVEVMRPQQPSMDWNELVNQATFANAAKIPTLLLDHPSVIPVFLMVFAHRYGKNLVVWNEQRLFEK